MFQDMCWSTFPTGLSSCFAERNRDKLSCSYYTEKRAARCDKMRVGKRMSACDISPQVVDGMDAAHTEKSNWFQAFGKLVYMYIYTGERGRKGQ